MESISKILDAISAEAKSEADQIAQNGRKSTEEVLRLYQKEAAIERENILKNVVFSCFKEKHKNCKCDKLII